MKIDETLSLVKELHSYSIINKDTYYSDKLLQIIINLSTVGEVKNLENTATSNESEIAKVKRKVPKWMKKTNQYNYLILKAFMDLSNYNENRVPVDKLEEYVDIGKAFLANYNNLKTISEKNHGKVFDEIDREVELWEPVAEFIEELFKKNIASNDMVDNLEKEFREYALTLVQHRTTIDGYVRSLNEDLPRKLNMCSIFDIKDTNELNNLYSRCSTGGDLHDWSMGVGHGRPQAAIGKYMKFIENRLVDKK